MWQQLLNETGVVFVPDVTLVFIGDPKNANTLIISEK